MSKASFANILLLLLLAGCTLTRSAEVAVPEVGKSMPARSSMLGIAHKGRTLCTHWIEVASVIYNFDVLCGSKVVVYIQVSDPKFRTPEGLEIGVPLATALRVRGADWRKLDNSCGVVLPSGWIARAESGAPEFNESCGDAVDSLIDFFEKR